MAARQPRLRVAADGRVDQQCDPRRPRRHRQRRRVAVPDRGDAPAAAYGLQENGALLLDLLWSDPTASDAVEGVHTNHERGHPVVCYGPDRVKSFLEANNLSLILRAHECVMDGFQRFAGGRLITVFSATNYCNRWANAGAILLVGKDLEIVPKMIYPLDDLEDAWIDAPHPERSPANDTPPPEDLREMRPPTPPRDAPEELREMKAEKDEDDVDDDEPPPEDGYGPATAQTEGVAHELAREGGARGRR